MPAVGWVPLAPFEVYHPYYRTSVAYVRNVNITSVNRTVINNITVVNRTTAVNNYANQRAATVVPSAAFTRAAPVHRAVLEVPHDELVRARVAPTVEHLRPTPAARAGGAIPAAAEMPGTRPHEPASIARTPLRAEFTPPSHAEPSVPTSPGPEFGHRLDRNGPPRLDRNGPPRASDVPPRRDVAPPPAPGPAPRDTRATPPGPARRDEARPTPPPNLAGPLMVRPVQPPTRPQPPQAAPPQQGHPAPAAQPAHAPPPGKDHKPGDDHKPGG